MASVLNGSGNVLNVNRIVFSIGTGSALTLIRSVLEMESTFLIGIESALTLIRRASEIGSAFDYDQLNFVDVAKSFDLGFDVAFRAFDAFY